MQFKSVNEWNLFNFWILISFFQRISFIILHGSPIFFFHLLLIRWKMMYSPFHIVSLLFRVWLILFRDGEHEEWLENSCKFSPSIVSNARNRTIWYFDSSRTIKWLLLVFDFRIYIYYLFLKFNENIRISLTIFRMNIIM